MKNNPLVSVFIPYYNDKKFLKDSIESVLNQTYQNWELILLNHASTDGSKEIAHSYKDNRIKHIDVDKNLGAGSAILMEYFLEIAHGKYAKLFCADDIMLPNCIEILVSNMETNPQLDIIYADMEYVDINKKSFKTKWSKERPRFSFDYNELDVLTIMFNGLGILPYPSSIVKLDILKKIQKDPTFIMLVDMDIWAKAIINGSKIKFIKDVVVNYRIHNLQTASSHNSGIVHTVSYFESLKYIELFNSIKDVNIIKRLCAYVPFIDTLTQNDVEFFPFVLAYNNMHISRPSPYRNFAYTYIHDLLLDPIKSKKIQDRFGFGIKEFRALYSQEMPKTLLIIKVLRKIKRVLKLLFKYRNYTE